MKKYLLGLVLISVVVGCSVPQDTPIPLVYDVENTGASFADPVLPERDALPVVKGLTDPLAWSDGSGRVTDFASWSKRRAEIAGKSSIMRLERSQVSIRARSRHACRAIRSSSM